VSVRAQSVVVVVNPSIAPPRWTSDLSQIKVFATWDAYETSTVRGLLGPWQTKNGPVTLVAGDDARFFVLDDQGNRLEVAIQPSKIYVPSQNNEGRLNTARSTIDWNDGSIWTRIPPGFENDPKYRAVAGLLGQWYYDGKRCRIEFSGLEDNELLLVNEQGQAPFATLRGRTIYASVWRIHGDLSADGKIINWSNGTIWRR
jgi:hypothetical protein